MSKEFQQLHAKDPEMGDMLTNFARELFDRHGATLRVHMPDGGEGAIGRALTEAPPPRVDPVAVVTAQPAKGEVSREQAASWARAGMTALSSMLGTLSVLGMFGWLTPEHVALLNNPALVGVVGLVIFAAARAWSLRQSKTKAKEKSQEVTAALQMPATQADHSPTTVEDVKAAAVQAVTRATGVGQ